MKKLISNYLKPNNIDDIIGQSHLLGSSGIIKRMISNKKIFSCIFYGPPGTGKTSMAISICNDLEIPYELFNPTINKKSDLEKILLDNLKKDSYFVIIIDEFHRLNRDKQDILLSYLEWGNLIIFGTTTENPFFVVNPAIRSRCQIIQLKQLNKDEVLEGLKKISKKLKMNISNDVLKMISINTDGDLRKAINTLDVIESLYKNSEITKEILDSISPLTSSLSSGYGDEFYDLQSAFHKSIRGSDVDAAIYYLARLIKAGDLISISRRIISSAYEDIGLANPTLLSRVVIGMEAVVKVGFPEAHQILSSIVIEMCLSPKSNSAYLAINKALNSLETGDLYRIPSHLRDNNYKSHTKLGHGGYKYPHDYKNSWVNQQYLPDEIKDSKFYDHNKDSKLEVKMVEIWEKNKTTK
ncbi:MAG: replication-associated recombination protein A [Metamycoplasmataceae bacterium]